MEFEPSGVRRPFDFPYTTLIHAQHSNATGAKSTSSTNRLDSYRTRFEGTLVSDLYNVFLYIDRKVGIHLDANEVIDFLSYMMGQSQSLAPFYSATTATTSKITTTTKTQSSSSYGEQGGDASSTTTAEDVQEEEEDTLMERSGSIDEEIERLRMERKRQQELIEEQRRMLKQQEQDLRLHQQRIARPPVRASMSSATLRTVRNRCRELFNNEGHDPRMCFDCKHCDHAAWPVDAHEEGDDRSNGRKRRRPAKTHNPRLDAILRNRIYYHGRAKDYKTLEYPFCAMDESSILETQDLFRGIAQSFNRRYRGKDSKAGEEDLLVVQLIELQKTINDVYMSLNEGERVMTDGILGRCTIRHLSAVGRIYEKHHSYLTKRNVPGLQRVVLAARALNMCETKNAASSGPTSTVVQTMDDEMYDEEDQDI